MSSEAGITCLVDGSAKMSADLHLFFSSGLRELDYSLRVTNKGSIYVVTAESYSMQLFVFSCPSDHLFAFEISSVRS